MRCPPSVRLKSPPSYALSGYEDTLITLSFDRIIQHKEKQHQEDDPAKKLVSGAVSHHFPSEVFFVDFVDTQCPVGGESYLKVF